MTKIIAIAKKEFLYFINSPFGYIFLFILTTITTWLFFSNLYINNNSSLDALFTNFFFILVFFVPAITMNSVSEEKKQANWEVILSLPVSDVQFIFGKFLGILTYSLLSLAILLVPIVTIFFIGKPDIGIVLGQLLSAFFFISTYISTGIFFSSLTYQPLIAFMSTFSFLLLSTLLSTGFIFSKLPIFIQRFVQFINLNSRMNSLNAGLIDIKDIVFFVSWQFIFIVLSILVIKKRNQ